MNCTDEMKSILLRKDLICHGKYRFWSHMEFHFTYNNDFHMFLYIDCTDEMKSILLRKDLICQYYFRGSAFHADQKKRDRRGLFFFASVGWKTGFEPATLGTTNRCSNQLSYNHHLNSWIINIFMNFLYLLSHLLRSWFQLPARRSFRGGGSYNHHFAFRKAMQK